MNGKYEITEIEHPRYPWLHRIRALRDIREDVHAGDLGGFVESAENLSQEGNCWIYDDAMSCEDAEVLDESIMKDSSIAEGYARIYGVSELCGNAVADKNAVIMSARLLDSAVVTETGIVRQVEGIPYVPVIKDNAVVFGRIEGNVQVSGNFWIRSNAEVINLNKERLYLHSSEFTAPIPKRAVQFKEKPGQER